MKPLRYLLFKSLKNIILELKKKPLILVGYIFAFLSFVILVIVSFIMPVKTFKTGSTEVYGIIVSLALMLVFYFDFKQGINSGSSFFRLADVNFVFTSPISPKHVLLYGFIKQFFKTFIMLLFMSFQIPNLKNNFPINSVGVIIIYASTFFLFFTMPLIGMLIYSITSKSKIIRRNFEKALNIVIYAVIGIFFLVLLGTGDFEKSAAIIFNSEYFTLIPYIGWFKNILLCAVEGINVSFYLNVALVLISTALMVIAVYKLRTDYYEDVLAATEKLEELIKVRKQGKGGNIFRGAKLKNVKHSYNSFGAKTIFLRHMLEYKKTGFFLVNRNTIIILIIGLGAKQFFPFANIKYILYFSLYMQFFFSLQGKWVQELDKPYIYLIPASSASKVFFATLAENLKNCIDGFVLFAAVGFVFKSNIIIILLNTVVYATYGAIYTYSDVLTRRLFGSTHGRSFEMLIKMLLVIFIVGPAVAVDVVLSLLKISQYLTYAFVITYNLAAAVAILFICRGIFEKLEMK
ncbi:MAG: putative ABC exporter domain-containing protein [Bacillota bacterium]|nr:putative ABC exporter domain-containing protein [Bacillota bacterium]